MTDHDLELERRLAGQEILREVRYSDVLCRRLAQWVQKGGELSFKEFLKTKTMTAVIANYLYPGGFSLVELRDPELGHLLWLSLRAEGYKPMDGRSGFTRSERARIVYLFSVGLEPVEKVLFTGLKYQDARRKRQWLFQKWKDEKNGEA